MANRIYNTCGMNVDGMNARQAFLKCKQGTPSFEIPKVKRCFNEPPHETNVYSDGSLINTRTNSFKLAGAGFGDRTEKTAESVSEPVTNHFRKLSSTWLSLAKKKMDSN